MKSSDTNENWLRGTLTGKCPHCGKGHVFDPNVRWYQLPVMNEKCSECAYHFDREPGYFLGAMYLSYAFAVLEGIIAFVLAVLFLPDLNVAWQILLVLGTIFVFGKKNYKMSRILYIHIFPW